MEAASSSETLITTYKLHGVIIKQTAITILTPWRRNI